MSDKKIFIGTLLIFLGSLVLPFVFNSSYFVLGFILIPVFVLIARYFQSKESTIIENAVSKNIIRNITDLDLDEISGLYYKMDNFLIRDVFRKHNHQYYAHDNKKEEIERIELFINILSTEYSDIAVQRRKFLDLPKSDTLFYRDVVLYCVNFILNNEIDLFIENYEVFIKTVDGRPETRIFQQKYNEIQFYDKSFSIDMLLLDRLYSYYKEHEDINDFMNEYKPYNNLHYLIHTISYYHYLDSIENNILKEDIEGNYNEMKALRASIRLEKPYEL